MATVAQATPRIKPKIIHDAYYHEQRGTAELLPGTGYLFRAAGSPQAIALRYTDPDLRIYPQTSPALRPRRTR